MLLAVKIDKPNMARWLVEQGGDLSKRDENHRTAEDIAREKGWSEEDLALLQ